MSDQAPQDPLLESGLESLLADLLDMAGDPHDRGAVIAAHREHAEVLREFLDNLDWIRGLAGADPTTDGLQSAARLAPPAAAKQCAVAGMSEAPPTTSSTVDVGRYVGWRPHARGGLGEVFTAEDTELHRVVALKRIQERHAEDARCRRHFLLEAEVTARLDHPGVVPVYSLFHDDADRPCYTMRFIEGQTMDDALRAYHAGPPDPVAFRRLLQSFIQACETIGYAHSRGVIHRDIKPQNIMLGKFGETIVVDWGLAKVVGRGGDSGTACPEATLELVGDSSLDRTAMGDAVGTPAYMSPEQAAGRWDVINAASDVYNLGAMLYALLTGRPPLEGGNWPEMQQKIQRGDFPRPRAVAPAVPRALEAICLKAMALQPDGRYSTAVELATDVERWLADEPVRAHREPAAERLRRWARRRKVLVTSGAVAFVVLLVSFEVVRRVKADADAKKLIAQLKIEGMQDRQNGSKVGSLMKRTTELEQSSRAAMERMASQVVHDPQLDGAGFRPLRRDLLEIALKFWDRAIKIDTTPLGTPGSLTPFYRRQRALCLARLGEYQVAATEAGGLEAGATEGEGAGEAAYDLARVYSACAAAALDDRTLFEAYANRSMEFLTRAARVGYFKTTSPAVPLDRDPDLAPLRPRGDFLNLTRAGEAKDR